MKKSLLTLLMLAPLTAGAADSTWYVQSARAKLLERPDFAAPVVAELGKGEPVTVTEADSRWVKVKVKEKSGWVARLVVGEQKPLNKVMVLEDKEESLDNNARRRASVTATAGAARGLAADDRQRASDAGLANYHALGHIEATRVSDAEALAFLAEGMKQQ